MTNRRRRTAREIASRSNRKVSQNTRVFLMIVIAVAGLVGIYFFREGCGEKMARMMSALDPQNKSQKSSTQKESPMENSSTEKDPSKHTQ